MSEKNPQSRLYTKWSVSWWTFLGGPLAWGYFLGKNFQALWNSEASRNSFAGWIIAMFAIVLFIIFTPEAIIEKIPNSVIPAIYTATVYWIMMQYQETQIQAHLKKGGERYTAWRTTGIWIISVIILFVILFWIVLILPESMIG